MIILRSLQEIQNWVSTTKSSEKSIGFVPTMGALHAGHISLVESSIKDNDQTIVSIFVNPTQFNNPEDLEKYPRTEDADIRLLQKSSVNAVFIPTIETIYPNGQNSISFDFNNLENQMEGKFRPGHFDGVGTVVKRLLEITQPTRAYFGEKDFQQLRIIQQMVQSEKLPVEIVPIAIKREEDGLAMSSRNVRLSKEMRKEAPIIYQILTEVKSYLENHTITETKKWVEKRFLQTKLNLEYFEIADEKKLETANQKIDNQTLRAFIAVFADNIRLIDNLRLN
ncbi:MAG: pantoate--beta-alanine ligase [Moheibacter sp.]